VIFRKHQRGGTIKVSSLVIFMLVSPDFPVSGERGFLWYQKAVCCVY
jgi:hypothetical protein